MIAPPIRSCYCEQHFVNALSQRLQILWSELSFDVKSHLKAHIIDPTRVLSHHVTRENITCTWRKKKTWELNIDEKRWLHPARSVVIVPHPRANRSVESLMMLLQVLYNSISSSLSNGTTFC